MPADGRIVAASALQIDESALTGESSPAAKDARRLEGAGLGPGDQTDMAFMNTPVTHGSGTLIVTGTGAGHRARARSRRCCPRRPRRRRRSPAELDRLTLWIAAAAGLTMVVMFVLGRSRGEAWDVLFVSAVTLAIAAVPEALPTVTQMILSLGGVDLAKRNAIVKELPSVETLGFTSAINSDKTGTLTMNQMTVVEVVDPGDRYTVSGTGYGLEGRIHHAAGTSAVHRGRDPALRRRERRAARRRQGRRRPDRGRAARPGAQGRPRHRRHPRAAPPAGHPAVRPDLQAHGDVHTATGADGRPVVRCFVKGAAPAVMARAATALSADGLRPVGRRACRSGRRRTWSGWSGDGRRVMAAAVRDLDPADFVAAGRPAPATSPTCR